MKTVKEYPFKRISALCIDILFTVGWKVIFILSSLFVFSIEPTVIFHSWDASHLSSRNFPWEILIMLLFYFIFHRSLLFFHKVFALFFLLFLAEASSVKNECVLSWVSRLRCRWWTCFRILGRPIFTYRQGSNYFLGLERREWHTAETFQPPQRGDRKLLFELLHNADRKAARECTCRRSRACKFTRAERTCVRGVEGPALKRTFQVVAEMQLCAAERGRDNGNRDKRHFLLARYRFGNNGAILSAIEFRRFESVCT